MTNTIIKAQNRYESRVGNWLRSFHIFSFSEYYDPRNIHFGNLRVFNDDYIRAKSGFGIHPHNNMEILTILLDGTITHGDSMGNRETIGNDGIQTMSAGSGIFHSEENLGEEETHLYQIWFLPRHHNTKPWYKDTKVERKENTLTFLVSGTEGEAQAYLDADIKVYEGNYITSSKFEYEITKGKGLFGYITSGKLSWSNEHFTAGDQFRFSEEGKYTFEVSETPTRCILIEVTL